MIPGVVSSQCRVPQVVGGTKSSVGSDTKHGFASTTSGIGFLKGASPGSNYLVVQILVVGGGGGGGSPTDRTGGGGGGGGVIEQSLSLIPSDHKSSIATIGAGGRGNAYPSASGNPSNLYVHNVNNVGQKELTYLAGGGGRGGGFGALAQSGGSGGGGYHNPEDSGRAATGDGTGNSGATGYDSGVGGSVYRGGGGGGAGSAGTTPGSTTLGAGGDGHETTITGSTLWFGAGGGGGAQINSGSLAPAPGGSNYWGGRGAVSSATTQYSTATDPFDYSGSGGGGGSRSSSGSNEGTNGASGYILLRYSTNP